MFGGINWLPRTLTSSVPWNEKTFSNLFKYESVDGYKAQYRHTISSLVKAVLWVAMRREYSHFMATILKTNRSIDYQAFCSSNTEIRMEEDEILRLRCHDYRSDLEIKR